MITVQVTGTEELKMKFSEMPMKLRHRLFTVIRGLSLQLEGHVKNDKLQGQVLNHITGHLQGSINSSAEQEGDAVTGRVYSNSSVNYAGIHEYGFSGSENVKSHIRNITQAFGREIEPRSVMVRSFTRQMNMPERSFLRSSLADMREKIIDDITNAAREACR